MPHRGDMMERARQQLSELARVSSRLEDAGIDYWLLGGWGVDFHVGSVTRAHDDVDLAVWLSDVARIDGILRADGWHHAPDEDEDGGTGYERGGVRLELTFLARDEDGVFIPLREARAPWPDDALGDEVRELRGARARVVPLGALTAMKAGSREDAADAAKDRADYEQLSRLGDP